MTGFRPPAGSSSITISGSAISAAASSSSFCWPNERLPACWSRSFRIPKNSSNDSARSLLVALDRRGEQRPEGQLADRHDHVLEHGHPLEDPGHLERPHQAEVDDVARPAPDDGHALDVDLSLLRLVEAGDAVEHRGLARAVGPDQGGDGALPDHERGVGQGLDAAERLADPGNGQAGRGIAGGGLDGRGRHECRGHDATPGSGVPFAASASARRRAARLASQVGMMPSGMNMTTSTRTSPRATRWTCPAICDGAR